MRVIYSRQHFAHDPELMYDSTENDFISHVETAERAEGIFSFLVNNDFTDIVKPEDIPLETLKLIHDPEMIAFFEKMSKQTQLSIPDSFAQLSQKRRPRSLSGQLGYFCTDMYTPIQDGTLSAVLYAAGAAFSGAQYILGGNKAAYALTRPPGHHAGRSFYGGFCYANNASLAAKVLSQQGKTLLLDLDYHHGNGSQDIFYDTDAVFFISLHSDPDYEYPYYSGYSDETGTGKGLGFTKNFPFAKNINTQKYLVFLEKALNLVASYKPQFLVISLGTDIFREDPVGKSNLEIGDFRIMGEQIRELNLPVLVVQEGGYNPDSLGETVYEFLCGLEN